MDSKLFFLFFLLISSWVFVGFSQSLDELSKTYGDSLAQRLEGFLQDAAGDGDSSVLEDANDGNPSMECLQKLLPCQAFLHSSSPPATCCLPLVEMIANESECLCSVLDDPGILQSFNINEESALDLAKACGAKPDLSVCKNGATSPTSSAAAPADVGTTADSNKTNAGHGMSPLEEFGFIISFVALVVSASI